MHLCHDHGLRPALPGLQRDIDAACCEALLRGMCWPNEDLEDLESEVYDVEGKPCTRPLT